MNDDGKKEIVKKLSEQFGIEDIGGKIVKRNEERLFLFSGSMDEKEIKKLGTIAPIERVGVYFAKIFQDKDKKEKIRLSIEGSQILKKQITKNVFELSEEQAEQWMKGHELQIKAGKKDFVIMKYKNYILGCGKASEEKITNFIPKNRRLKEKS